jgi:hypothetical protein
MADEKKAAKQYDSIIDAFLDQREPDWKELDLSDAKKSGDDWLDRAHEEVDTDFEDEIAESASRHTPIWGPKSGSEVYEDRIAEKEAAQPRIQAVNANWHKDGNRWMEDYKSKEGDNDSLMDEVTESLEKAYSGSNLEENSAAKKEVSDAQIFKYVKDLLNQGVSPAKVAQKLEKLAEIELFNHQSATDYLQRNAGLMGLAYLEPNTFMEKNSPKYQRQASTSNDCEAQKKAWDNAGIKPQAHSVKQVSACEGCTHFKKDASGKTCNLYHLPVVANTAELTQIVNHLTPGVPSKQKHAALVQIANGEGTRAKTATSILAQTTLIKTADAKVRNQEKRASYEFADNREGSKGFSSEHVAKMHDKGASLEQIYKWAEQKFGDVEVSFAFRGFVQNLRQNPKGRIVVASGDLKFLNAIGIRNSAFEGKEKCASCPTHFASPHRVIEDERGAQRVDQKFASKTVDVVRSQHEDVKEANITVAKVRTLHQAGHSVEKIFNGVASKIGSVQAKKVIAGFIEDMKKQPGKLPVSAADRSFLEGKLGFRPEQIRMLNPDRRPVTQVVASVPDDVNVMSYPGMEKHAGDKKHVDGHSILAEYDLTGSHEMQDIDTSEPKRDDIETSSTFKVDLD